MSKRKKSDDEGAVVMIIAIIAAIIILAPVFILLYLIYQLFQKSKHKAIKYNISSIWLNTDEKIQFIKCYETYTYLNEKVTDTHQIAKNKQIPTNKDGSYSKRSNIGKQIFQY